MVGLEAALVLLKVAGNKLVSLVTTEFASISGVTKDLSELQDILGEVTSWLSAVRDRAIESDPSLRWVMKLKNVIYDIDDLLDEVHLEAEKHERENNGNNLAVVDCFCSKPKSFLFQCKMAHKINAIKSRFAAIVKQRSDVNTLRHNLPLDRLVTNRNRATEELSLLSNVEESKIPVRNKEKGDIISKLLESSEGENDWIVSIVGLGGSGKTTLAKQISHDHKVKVHFNDTIFRVHVSHEFHMEKLISKLFEAITKQKSDIHARQYMVDEISNKLNGKKFLLVMDDAWHEDKDDWEQFMLHINSGAPGSKLLLTTRCQKVAEAVKSRHIFHLTFLSETESWSLFLKCSGWMEEDLGSELLRDGKEIVKRCGGVPLAIKTLGGVLSGKKEINTWKAIRESNLWNVESVNDRVFASLKLSYFHLADNLKQCFTFCSIFPKGYKIIKEHLIAQWIAHGFVHPTNKEHPEDIGSDYFDSLVKVGFLQDSSQIWYNNQLVYKMHDLIHDLARLIVQDEIVTSLPKTTTNCTHRCRYLSLMSSTEKVDMYLFQKVRAIYVYGGDPSFDKSIKKSCYIRSVILQSTSAAWFSPSILKSEYLCYLEICHVSFTDLPEAISGCWNLQALYVMHCSDFVRLPESIGKLKKLRILGLMMCTAFERLPQSIGDCQELRCMQLYFCANLREIPKSICKLEKLMALHVTASLSLEQLPSKLIGELNNLQTLNLSGCTHLKDLPSIFACSRLRKLVLSNTNVTVLPQWVTLIGTLECIELEYCTELVELPTGMGNLEKLEVLNIQGCWRLCCMPSGLRHLIRLRMLGLFVIGFGGNCARILELENLDMLSGQLEITNLRYLNDPREAVKACLKQKKKLQCLKLTWWSSSGMQEELVPDMEQDLGVLDALEPPPEITVLEISGYRSPHLPRWMRKQCDSSCLEGTVMKTKHPRFHGLTQLVLEQLPNLKHMRGLVELPSLKAFNLHGMSSLEELWTVTNGLETGEENGKVQHCFPVLSALFVWNCPKLNVKPYFPPSLEWLRLQKSNEQLLSPDSSSSRLVQPDVDESPSSFGTLAGIHLKKLKLEEMMASSSGWELLQQLTTLESLEIRLCNDLRELPASMRSLISLQRLHVDGCSALAMLPEWLGELCSLQELSVVRTPMIDSLPQSTEHLTSLVELKIVGWGNLHQLPVVIKHLTSLQVLSLEGCNALCMLPDWIGRLSALRLLRIDRCSALQSLPHSIKYLTALRSLSITGCPGLARRYKKGVGDEWHLVSHIPHVMCY